MCFVLKKYEKMKEVTSRKKEVLKSREAEHMIYRVTQFPEMHSKSDKVRSLKKNDIIWEFFPNVGPPLANFPAVFLSYFSLWICYEIQPAVGTLYTAVQNV